MANASLPSENGIKLINDLLRLHGQLSIQQIPKTQTIEVEATRNVSQFVPFPVTSVPAEVPALSVPVKAKKRSPNAATNSIQKRQQLISLPHARVRTIMKTAPNVSFLSQEAVLLAAKSAEMFIRKLAKESYQHASTQDNACKMILYPNLVKARNVNPFRFLKDFIPQKITVTEYQRLINDQQTDKTKPLETKNIHDKNS